MSVREASAAGRIRVIHHHESLGMEAASNAAIRASASEFLAVHDDDDTWDPDFLHLTVDYLNTPSSPDDGVMVPTEIIFERIDGASILEEGRELFLPEMREITLFEMVKANRAVPISFLYRRSVLEDIGLYDESLPAVGDWEFNLRFLQSRSVGFLTGRPLAFWHQRPHSSGVDSNSIFASQVRHNQFDLLVREDHFQRWVEDHGIGLPLFFNRTLDREIGYVINRVQLIEDSIRSLEGTLRTIEQRLERMERQISDNSLLATVKRKYRKHILRQK